MNRRISYKGAQPSAPPKSRKRIPFEFVLDAIAAREPVVKPMFGCYGVYVGGKMVFILRERKTHPEDNGMWLATSREHHESLRKEFPSMRSIGVLSSGVTGWQLLASSEDDFERNALNACKLVLRGDSRIGKLKSA